MKEGGRKGEIWGMRKGVKAWEIMGAREGGKGDEGGSGGKIRGLHVVEERSGGKKSRSAGDERKWRWQGNGV